MNSCAGGEEGSIGDLINLARGKLIPEKSKSIYLTCYQNFKTWLSVNNVSISEDIMMAYFEDISNEKAPSTLWSVYSMLKKTIRQYDNVDISEFANLIDLLKIKAEAFQPKKAKVFTTDEVNKFLTQATNDKHLATKVALIFGVQGASRKNELHKMSINDVKDCGSFYEITIPKTKTSIVRNFVVGGQMYNVVKEYISHRPEGVKVENLFLNWQKGKCTRQVIGINKLGSMPFIIATFLKLPQPELYTGHTFRRTLTTILADAEGDLLMLKRHAGWKSNQVAEEYIEDSVENKKKISTMISTSILKPSINTTHNENQSPNIEGINVGVSSSNNSATMEFPGTDLLHISN